MQKRIFSLLLVVVLLASMMVAPAYAEGAASENVTDTATVCGCGCGKKFSEITWKLWKALASR